MRIGLLIAVVVAALFAAVMTTAVVAKVVTDQHAAQAQAAGDVSCDAAIGPTQVGFVQAAQAQAANLRADQRQIVSLIVSMGKQRGLSPRAWQIAIQAGMTESGLRNLDYGDRVFQLADRAPAHRRAHLEDAQ